MAKVTLVGAGSASFAVELIRDVIATPGLRGSRMTLMDIDEDRLGVALRIAERYRDEAGAELTFAASSDLEGSLEGAEFVICAVKVGGYGPLEEERRIAEEHGYYRGIGDRVSCYYGGVGAFHQFKFLMELARAMERVCPQAWLIQTANPVFDGTNLITRQTRVKAVGVCHGHFAYRRVAETVGLDLEAVSAQVVGFNHYVWLTRFLHRGRDAYPLIDEWVERKSEDYWRDGEYPEQMSPGAVDAYRLYGLFPIGDAVRAATPWWHHTNPQAKRKWYGRDGGFDSEIGWSRYLQRKEEHRKTWSELAGRSDVRLLEKYPLERGSEQHVAIVDAVANDRETELQLNVPNRGCLPGVPDDVLVEIPVLVSGRGMQGVKVGALPPRVMNNVMLPRLLMMENMHTAFLNGDRKSLVLALAGDPRTRSFEQAKGLIDALLAQPWNAEAEAHYRW
jgi:alpha-galactosidase